MENGVSSGEGVVDKLNRKHKEFPQGSAIVEKIYLKIKTSDLG